jgi:hypothetical protein
MTVFALGQAGQRVRALSSAKFCCMNLRKGSKNLYWCIMQKQIETSHSHDFPRSFYISDTVFIDQNDIWRCHFPSIIRKQSKHYHKPINVYFSHAI